MRGAEQKEHCASRDEASSIEARFVQRFGNAKSIVVVQTTVQLQILVEYSRFHIGEHHELQLSRAQATAALAAIGQYCQLRD